MSPPRRRRRREAIAGKEPPLSEKTAIEVLLKGRSGGPSLRGAYLSDCICPLVRVSGVATESLQSCSGEVDVRGEYLSAVVGFQ